MKKFVILLGSLCIFVVINLFLLVLVILFDFDYKLSLEEYYLLLDFFIFYRILFRKFDFLIIIEIDIDNNVSIDNLIIDVFVDNLFFILIGIILDELLCYRVEYIVVIEVWGEEVIECLN